MRELLWQNLGWGVIPFPTQRRTCVFLYPDERVYSSLLQAQFSGLKVGRKGEAA